MSKGSHLPVLARMAIIDVARRPWRLGFLAMGIALAGAAAFGALVFHSAIGSALGRSLARLGADAAIVPAEITANLTPVLLTVEPSSSHVAPEALQQLAALPVVESLARQRTLKLADINGHLPVDIVVFDPNTDMTVMPWVVEALRRPFATGDVLVGGRRPEGIGEKLQFQGVELVVYGRLGLTGAGPFERSIFLGEDTARQFAEANVATADGQAFPFDPLKRPSGALIRLAGGEGPEELRFATASVPGVKLIVGSGSQIAVRQSVKTLADSTIAMLMLSLLAPAVLVGVAYTGMLAERRCELGTMLALGVPRRDIVATVAIEAGLAGVTGTLIGVILAFAGVTGFFRTIGFGLEKQAISISLPSFSALCGFALESILLVTITAIGGAVLAAWLAAAQKPWALLRGDSP